MKTVRRLYFYAVALISIEVVLWGLINLLRSIVSQTVGGTAEVDEASVYFLSLDGVLGSHLEAALEATKDRTPAAAIDPAVSSVDPK